MASVIQSKKFIAVEKLRSKNNLIKINKKETIKTSVDGGEGDRRGGG